VNKLCRLQIRGICDLSAAHVHHRKLRRHGDERDVNKLDVCAPCHESVHKNVARSYALGWLVHSWDDPAQVEVRLRDCVVCDDAGCEFCAGVSEEAA